MPEPMGPSDEALRRDTSQGTATYVEVEPLSAEISRHYSERRKQEEAEEDAKRKARRANGASQRPSQGNTSAPPPDPQAAAAAQQDQNPKMTSLEVAHQALSDAIGTNANVAARRFHVFGSLSKKIARGVGANEKLVKAAGTTGWVADVVLDGLGSLALAAIKIPRGLTGFIDTRIDKPIYERRFKKLQTRIKRLKQIPAAQKETVAGFVQAWDGTYPGIDYEANGSLIKLEGALARLEDKYHKELAEIKAKEKDEKKNKGKEVILEQGETTSSNVKKDEKAPTIGHASASDVSTNASGSHAQEQPSAEQPGTPPPSRGSLKVAHADEVQVNGGATEKTTTPDQNAALSTTRRTAGLRPKV